MAFEMVILVSLRKQAYSQYNDSILAAAVCMHAFLDWHRCWKLAKWRKECETNTTSVSKRPKHKAFLVWGHILNVLCNKFFKIRLDINILSNLCSKRSGAEDSTALKPIKIIKTFQESSMKIWSLQMFMLWSSTFISVFQVNVHVYYVYLIGFQYQYRLSLGCGWKLLRKSLFSPQHRGFYSYW